MDQQMLEVPPACASGRSARYNPPFACGICLRLAVLLVGQDQAQRRQQTLLPPRTGPLAEVPLPTPPRPVATK
jgi:hypothetical protein